MNEFTKEGNPNLRTLSSMLNPYGMKQEEMARVQAFVSHDDKYLLKSVYPTQGLESCLLAGVYKAVCSELRSLGITSYTPQNARTVSQIVARYITPLPAGGQGHKQDVQGGSSSLQPTPANPPLVPANVHETAPGRRGDRGGLIRERAAEVKKQKAQSRPEQAPNGPA